MEVRVPDIGDFTDVPVIEILVGRGRRGRSEETPLVVLESDKATMEIPSPAAGKVGANRSRSATGSARAPCVLTLETADGAAPERQAAGERARGARR